MSTMASTKKRKSPLSKEDAANSPACKKSSTTSGATQRKGKKSTAGQSREASAILPEGSRNQSLDPEGGDDDDGDEDDDDDDDGQNESGAQASTGSTSRSKTAPSKNNRKAQNRNAQRESRQRKIEYVKALEGYVAFRKLDQDSALQGLLFAIGWIMEENMKLRGLLGHMSAFFMDATQGTRLPELLGVTHADLKRIVETNDKVALLELGEKLRSKFGTVTNEAIAREVALRQNLDQKIKLKDEDAANPGEAKAQSQSDAGGAVSLDADAAERKSGSPQPIFGSLSAAAEKQLLRNIHLANTPGATLASLASPVPPSESDSTGVQAEPSSNRTSSSWHPQSGMSPDGSAAENRLEDLLARANATRTTSNVNANPPVAPSAVPAADSSTNSTPLDFNEYINTNQLGASPNIDLTDYLLGGVNGSLGFQMPDFTSLSAFLQPPHASSSYNYGMSGNSPFGQNLFPQSNPGQGYSQTVASTSQTPYVGSGAPGHISGATAPVSYTNVPAPNSVSPSVSTSNWLEVSKTLHQQARHLISFHLRAVQEDTTHQLPLSLQPTSAQSMMPHDPRIDQVVWPSMRDRLIFGTGKLDLDAVIASLNGEGAIILHAGGDLLDLEAWEVTEEFSRSFPSLIDGEILRVCNKWRMARGENPLYL